MSHCDSTRENLTAWIDGELRAPDEQLLTAHLDTCPSCTAEAAGLRQAISWQVHTLPKGLLETPVDVAGLRLGLHRRLAAVREREESAPSWNWSWLFRPFAMATAAVAVAVLAVVWQAGEPETLLVSIGVEQPPSEVVNNTERFRYLDVIQNLEALEHFDAVEAISLEGEQVPADTGNG